MANHTPDSISYREGLDESPFAHGDPDVDQRVAVAFGGGPLAEAGEQNEITEHGCVDSRWSDTPSILIGIPEDIGNRPDESTTPDQGERNKRQRTIGQPDPNIETVFEDESHTTDIPTREQCVDELEAWEVLKVEADRILEEFAVKIQHERATARAYCQRPPVTFTYDIPRGKGMSYIAEGLGTLISRSIERAGWSLEATPLPNGDLRITIS